ncbi:hypothetical protein ACYSNR_09585 [Enterococcus sp. LJL128]
MRQKCFMLSPRNKKKFTEMTENTNVSQSMLTDSYLVFHNFCEFRLISEGPAPAVTRRI